MFVGVVGGGNLVEVFLGGANIARTFTDAAQAVVQFLDLGLIGVFLGQLEGFLVVAFPQLGRFLAGTEHLGELVEGLAADSGSVRVAGLLELGDRLVGAAGADGGGGQTGSAWRVPRGGVRRAARTP